jgi:hypothetical protein
MLNHPPTSRRPRPAAARPRLRLHPALSRQELLLLGLTVLLFTYILLHFVVPLLGRPGLY